MKKILALLVCVLLILSVCTLTVSANTDAGAGETPETTETTEKPVTERIVDFITENFEGTSFISLAVTVVVYLFYEIRKHKTLKGAIGVLNNNAVGIAEKSAEVVQNVMKDAGEIAEVVNAYKAEMEKTLAEIRKSAAEKESLEETLHNVQTFLSTAKLATIELSNEVAELLVLANIPPSKKEELYARHVKAVNAISVAEEGEGTNNDGNEA